jgi:signal transduction histidine kinase
MTNPTEQPMDQPSPQTTTPRAKTDTMNRRYRILIVDDNPAIHADYRKILTPAGAPTQLDLEERELFGDTESVPEWNGRFDVDYAFQGEEALKLVVQALRDNDPYAVTFVDGRMPPGWDGVETISNLWEHAPDLQVVICTAYSDYSWNQILHRLGRNDNFVILKKPFDPVEVLQLAHALSRKWHLYGRVRQQILDLNDVVDERTAELQKTNAQLQAAIQELAEVSRMKSEFVSNMSHELRTPLNGILGMTEWLEETNLTAEQRDSVETIKLSGNCLLKIVEELLDFSKIDSGNIAIQCSEFHPRAVLDRITAFFQQQAAAKHLNLKAEATPDVPEILFGDAPHLAQVLLHLTSNAIKFTEKGTVRLTLSLHSSTRDQTYLSVKVQDTGIGISHQKLAKLFNPFVQADGSSTRRFGGAGLGLAICRRLADLMGGTLTADSAPGLGSVFTLTIPFYNSAHATKTQAA